MAPQGWLDVHGHFYLPQADDERKEQIKSMRGAAFMVPYSWNWTPEDTLKYMDQAGIQMQMLSYLPPDLAKLKKANDYAHELVKKHPSRFGQLAAIPTDDTEAALKEIKRAQTELNADGYAVSAVYKGVMLSDERTEPIWALLNDMKATVFMHPNAYAGPTDGRPAPLIEVAFETTRVVVDMLYKGIFRRFKDIKFVIAHSGGVLPMLSGRLMLLGTETWVPNPENITQEEIKEQLSRLYVDTAATAETGLQPASKMVGIEHVVYGDDCGVPCSTASTMEANRESVLKVAKSLGFDGNTIGGNAWKLFPLAAKRAAA